ncbi:MAG: sulfatase-like hydrolase/transferase [Planctomycetota bacterium]|nr:sulfatase-like hydrolase/transferase [Planctomycetota bacterium]
MLCLALLASAPWLGPGGCATPSGSSPARSSPGATRRPPSIVLFVADDQGYRDLGCYGGLDIRTPNLDRLAAGGARLTSFYVTWPACTPSRGSLLTGRYPQRNGTYDMIRNEAPDYGHRYAPEDYAVTWERIGGMDTREVLLPRMLRSAGYASGIFGKWDLGSLRRFLPLARGFDDFYGFVNTGVDYFTHERYGVPSMVRGDRPTVEDRGTYTTEIFRREALRFLDEHRDEPFFLYVPFNAPHNASNLDAAVRRTVQAPEEYKKLYPEPKDDREARRRSFMAAVTCMDEAIGAVLDRLEEYGLDDETIVIFLSDNGGGGASDNTPLRGGKSRMFEGGLRVPCLVRWPGRIPAGTVSGEFLTSLEIVPTLLGAAGVAPPEGVVLDGFDMLPVLRGEASPPRQEMFWERRADRAARVGHWKWVESRRGGGLFDLSQDVGERRDLSAEKPDVLERLKERFAAWKGRMRDAEPRGPFRDY